MSKRIKATTGNIIGLWFGADTPIKQDKIRSNPVLWAACLRVDEEFALPSGGKSANASRKADKVLFARAVQQYLGQTESKELLQGV